ncbi:MAG: Nif11-like leader peptide family RiPP precursor [Actinomycetota bacterium]
MSIDNAQRLVQRLAGDAELSQRLANTDRDGRQAILAEEGFEPVTLRELSAVMPQSHGGELSDEEFAAVAGGSSSSGLLASATIGASVASGAATISLILAASA